jgi:hypothetical protein
MPACCVGGGDEQHECCLSGASLPWLPPYARRLAGRTKLLMKQKDRLDDHSLA